MDRLFDSNGNQINVPIGAIAVNNVDPDIVYAGTGVADAMTNSYPGVGVLKSTDAGKTWKLVGTNVFNGARISKIAVSGEIFNASGQVLQPERVFVGVAAGGAGPGLYRSEDGGATWTNVLDPANNMVTSPNPPGTLLGAGVQLGSVTDVLINPYNPENVFVAIGNIGLLPASISGGVWRSPNHGGQWQQLAQGINRN